MSKVLVDRELLERCVDRWACCAIVETPGAEQAWLELRAVVKAAQPAEAEGVEAVAWLHRQGNHTEAADRPLTEDEEARGWEQDELLTVTQHLAALSAVTAERDRLRKDAERWRYVSLQGDDTHWLNLLRVDLEDFGGNINAAVDALIDGDTPVTAAKEA